LDLDAWLYLNNTEEDFVLIDADADGYINEWELENSFYEQNEFTLLVGANDGFFLVSDYAASNPDYSDNWAVLFD